jgi:hypothetical protein
VQVVAKYSGSGLSPDDPIVISDVANNIEAVKSEYEFLESRYGRRGITWTLELQTLLEHEGRMMDRLNIKLKSGEKVTLYFDITKYFGLF